MTDDIYTAVRELTQPWTVETPRGGGLKPHRLQMPPLRLALQTALAPGADRTGTHTPYGSSPPLRTALLDLEVTIHRGSIVECAPCPPPRTVAARLRHIRDHHPLGAPTVLGWHRAARVLLGIDQPRRHLHARCPACHEPALTVPADLDGPAVCHACNTTWTADRYGLLAALLEE